MPVLVASLFDYFIDLLTSHYFPPLIAKPTRITDTSATLIDNDFLIIFFLPLNLVFSYPIFQITYQFLCI